MDNAYTRAPGSARIGRSRLLRGSDHLLSVTCPWYWPFVENYRRFFFRDIRAVTVHQTSTGTRCSVVFAILALALLPWPFVADDRWARLILVVPPALFMLALAFNIAAGPTCCCTIHTAVQFWQVGALTRVRQARKFLRAMGPLILREQQNPPAAPGPTTP
ncbi:MAG: hypothetical protein LLG01_10395 [Planctomycetaceae bacterium]|nr:hypothetical protein [Planctomycetaceae bacterium]